MEPYPAQHIQHIQYDKQGRKQQNMSGGGKKTTPRLCPYREYSVGTEKNGNQKHKLYNTFHNMNHITCNTRGKWGVEVIQRLAARQPGRGDPAQSSGPLTRPGVQAAKAGDVGSGEVMYVCMYVYVYVCMHVCVCRPGESPLLAPPSRCHGDGLIRSQRESTTNRCSLTATTTSLIS